MAMHHGRTASVRSNAGARCAECLPGLAFLLCLMSLALLASCSGLSDASGPQSFNAHLNGSYSYEAVTTSVR